MPPAPPTPTPRRSCGAGMPQPLCPLLQASAAAWWGASPGGAGARARAGLTLAGRRGRDAGRAGTRAMSRAAGCAPLYVGRAPGGEETRARARAGGAWAGGRMSPPSLPAPPPAPLTHREHTHTARHAHTPSASSAPSLAPASPPAGLSRKLGFPRRNAPTPGVFQDSHTLSPALPLGVGFRWG